MEHSDTLHRIHIARLPLHLLIIPRDLSQRSRSHTRGSPYDRGYESCLNSVCICRSESRVIYQLPTINSKNGEYHIHSQAPRILRRDAPIHLPRYPARATRYTRCTHGHRLRLWGRQAMESRSLEADIQASMARRDHQECLTLCSAHHSPDHQGATARYELLSVRYDRTPHHGRGVFNTPEYLRREDW